MTRLGNGAVLGAVALLTGCSRTASAQSGAQLLGRTAAERAEMRRPTPRTPATRRPTYVDSSAVEKNMVRVVIPLPVDDGPPDRSVLDYFAWVIEWQSSEPFTIALAADTAMRTTNMREILAASSVRLCPAAPTVSVRECVQPLKSALSIENGHIHMIVRDPAFVARVRRERPLEYVLGTISQRGRVESVAVPVIYRDGKVKR